MLKFFTKNRARPAAEGLYRAIVAQARQPVFYLQIDVADTEDGRFDMILLHMFLVLERLAIEGDAFDGEKQVLFDLLFRDLDAGLREKSIGDTGVKIRVQKMVEAFYGRMAAYRSAVEEGADASLLDATLRKNLYRKTEVRDASVKAMSDYVRRQSAHLRNIDPARFKAGEAPFLDIEKALS